MCDEGPAGPPEGSRELVERVRRELAARADRGAAPAMQRYARSSLPFFGVHAAGMRAACRAAFAAHPPGSSEAWRDAVLALWRQARFREERYAAIELARWPRCRRFRTRAALPLYEEMIVTGAWWDLVDGIASHLVGELVRAEPGAVKPVMRTWAAGDDIWLRRSAIICQLGLKADTDLELLADCIAPSLGRREFFLRKAIGWALRQHARIDPGWVLAYVRAHDGELSALSRREALRHLAGRERRAGRD